MLTARRGEVQGFGPFGVRRLVAALDFGLANKRKSAVRLAGRFEKESDDESSHSKSRQSAGDGRRYSPKPTSLALPNSSPASSILR